MRMLMLIVLVAGAAAFAGSEVLLRIEGIDTPAEYGDWIYVLSAPSSVPGLDGDLKDLLDSPPAHGRGRVEADAMDGSSVCIVTKELDWSSVDLASLMDLAERVEDIEFELLLPDGTIFLTLNFEKIEFLSAEEVDGHLELEITADALEWTFTSPGT